MPSTRKFTHQSTSHLYYRNISFDFFLFFIFQGYATLGHSVSNKNKNQNHFTPTIISPSLVLGGSSNAPLGVVAVGNSVTAGHSNATSIMPAAQMSVGGLLSPTQAGTVTSSFSEYRFKPEVVTTSNRIQESCI